ncbi:MAG: potassium-transporting ATPase subunit KdpA [Hyphomicrobiales bacterium]
MIPAGLAGILNPGPHGLSEILYAFSSGTGNNGSAFAGLTANAPWYDDARHGNVHGPLRLPRTGHGRAGSLAAKTKLAPSAGTFPTHGTLFVALLVGVILILNGLQYFPAGLGPIVEHFLMLAGKTF